MKKIFALAGCLSLFLGIASLASAQDYSVVETASQGSHKSFLQHWTFGATIGWTENTPIITMPTYADKLEYSKLSGFSYGTSARYSFNDWLYGRAELLMVQKNYKIERTDASGAGSIGNFLYTELTNEYVSLPVMAMVSFGTSFRVFGYFGGYVGVWATSHREGKTFSMNYLMFGDKESVNFEEDYEFDDKKDNRFDAGLIYGLGLSFTFAQHYEISAEGRYYYGLTDVHKDYMTGRIPQYNTTLSINTGFAYKF